MILFKSRNIDHGNRLENSEINVKIVKIRHCKIRGNNNFIKGAVITDLQYGNIT